MRKQIVPLLATAGLMVCRCPANADSLCQPSPSQEAIAVPLAATGAQGQTDANLLIGATLLLEIGKVDAQKALSANEPCSMGKLKVNGSDWTLTGGDRAFVRRVSSSNYRSPVASVYPFSDLLAALQASTDHTAPPPTLYLLLTSIGSVDTLWNAYKTVPSDAQLARDLNAAITGQSSPVASVDVFTKKVNVFVSKQSG